MGEEWNINLEFIEMLMEAKIDMEIFSSKINTMITDYWTHKESHEHNHICQGVKALYRIYPLCEIMWSSHKTIYRNFTISIKMYNTLMGCFYNSKKFQLKICYTFGETKRLNYIVNSVSVAWLSFTIFTITLFGGEELYRISQDHI